MFEISFPELMVLALVALVVIGPDRLPKAARTAGLFLGRMRRYVNDVKADIDREMRFDELRKMQAEIQDSVRRLEQNIHTEFQQVEQGIHEGFPSFQEMPATSLESRTPFPEPESQSKPEDSESSEKTGTP